MKRRAGISKILKFGGVLRALVGGERERVGGRRSGGLLGEKEREREEEGSPAILTSFRLNRYQRFLKRRDVLPLSAEMT